MVKNVKVISGLNYGDEGKGLVTNSFSSSNTIVVLSSNSSQRGHTVVHNGKRHVFKHFGSGTFKGAVTYFTGDFLINPAMFRDEYEQLISLGITPVVYCRASSLMVTPYDMLANQLLETFRGEDRFTTCGCGVWETRVRNRLKLKFTLDDLDFESLEHYYKDVRLRGHGAMAEFCTNITRYNFTDDMNFFKSKVRFIADDEEEKRLLHKFDTVLFENSQGLLLDTDYCNDWNHTTPAHVGVKYPAEIIERNFNPCDIDLEVIYITRSYFTRHGRGNIGIQGECSKGYINRYMIDLTNVENKWQGKLRYGYIVNDDIKAMLNRILQDSGQLNISNYKKSIVITHLNEYYNADLVDFMLNSKQIDRVYESYNECDITEKSR